MNSEKSKAGTLDPCFGNGGQVYPELPEGSYGFISAITMGPNNKIYYGGNLNSPAYEHSYFLGRLNADGTPDTAFGENGIVIDTFGDFEPPACHSITVTDDKQLPKVLWVGELISSERTALARYNADGKPDKTFGAGNTGKVLLDLDLGQTAPSAVKVEHSISKSPTSKSSSSSSSAQTLPGGKLLISKYYLVNWDGPAMGYLIRLNPDGSLDESFNKTGYVTVSHPDYRETFTQLTSIMVQDDGKYLGCGAVWAGSPSPHIPMFVRYDTKGEPDTLFGTNGFSLVDNPEAVPLRLSNMAKQNNGRILGIGAAIPSFSHGALINIDPTGRLLTQWLSHLPDSITFWIDGAVHKDGKIVVTGGIKQPPHEGFDVIAARFLPNGDPDLEYNGKGWISTHLGAESIGYSMAMQEDEKIVVAVEGASRPTILRYLG